MNTHTSREPRRAIRVLRFLFFIVLTSRFRSVMNTHTSREPRHAIRVLRFLFFIVLASRFRLVMNTHTKKIINYMSRTLKDSTTRHENTLSFLKN